MRAAFVKFNGLGVGGTERWMQMMAQSLPEMGYETDYFSCSLPGTARPSDQSRREALERSGVRVLDCAIQKRDLRFRHHPWVGTDFWDEFNSEDYDLVQAGKAGHPEYPFTEMKGSRLVEFRGLDARLDRTRGIRWSVHVSDYQRRKWLKRGGDPTRSSVIPVPVQLPKAKGNLRHALGLDPDTLIFGFHQRNSDEIYSSIPLAAFSALELSDAAFVILGGSEKYSHQASELGMRNFVQLEHTGDDENISLFLQTLDVFSHGRGDGETFGAVLAEAMSFGLPCLSHYVPRGSNAQPETMGPGGLFASDARDYVLKLKDLSRSLSFRQDLGSAGLEFAEERYTLEATTKSLRNVYETVMSDETSPFVFSPNAKTLGSLPSPSSSAPNLSRPPLARVRAMLSRAADRLSYDAYRLSHLFKRRG